MTRFPEFANTTTPYAVVTRHAGRAKANVIAFHARAQGIVGIWGNYPHVVLFSHIDDVVLYELLYE